MTFGKIGARRMMANLPYDAEVEYLQTQDNGGQCIDLDINSYDDTGFETTITSWSGSSYYSFLIFESYAWSQQRYGSSIAWVSGGTTNQTAITYGTTSVTHNFTTVSPQTHTILCDPARGIFFDGTKYGEPFNSGMSSDPQPIVLLARYSKATGINGICSYKARIGATRIFRSTDNLRDLIPVRVGTVGYMYDRVSRRLFGNNGTGAFIVGPDKIA